MGERLAGIEGLVATVAKGDVRLSLEAIRDGLALALERAQPSEVASLSKQLADVVERIAGLPVREASAVDDLAAKRRARRAGVPDSSASGGQRRVGGDGSSG